MLLVAGAALALGGCGGGGTTEVDGCTIEPDTVCRNADFSDADLSDENLSGADLSGATLKETDLSGANLTEADLTNAQITDTNLDDANLTRTNLSGATIDGTDLTGATLCGTIRTDGTTDDSDCPASGGTTSSTTTTSSGSATTTTGINPNLPEVVSLVGPATAGCRQGTNQTSITITWATRKATQLQWAVDGKQIDGPTAFSGSAQFAFACAAASHTYMLRASNEKQEFATDSVTVQRTS
jgi:hypothetical protein